MVPASRGRSPADVRDSASLLFQFIFHWLDITRRMLLANTPEEDGKKKPGGGSGQRQPSSLTGSQDQTFFG
jgi:hypothetical protein